MWLVSEAILLPNSPSPLIAHVNITDFYLFLFLLLLQSCLYLISPH